MDKQKNYAVAYLDMLGTTNMIHSSNSLKAQEELHSLYRKVVGVCNDSHYNQFRIKIFSDNIIIAREIDESFYELCLSEFISVVAMFQFEAVSSYAWPVRGGITIGQLFLDDIMVWGQSLLRSYELESQIAIYPRIVFDSTPSILDTFEKSGINLANYVSKDFDSQYYLNYIYGRWVFKGFRKNMFNALERMKMRAQNKNGIINDRTFQKLCWHKNYINASLKKMEPDNKAYTLKIAHD